MVLRKEIVKHNFPDLPDDVAERLNGVNGSVEQICLQVGVELLRKYLIDKYGEDKQAHISSLKRMLANRHRMMPIELKAVQWMLKKLDGKGGKAK